jgi:hypothetical protein
MTFTRRKFNRKFRGGKKKTIRKKRKTKRKRGRGTSGRGTSVIQNCPDVNGRPQSWDPVAEKCLPVEKAIPIYEQYDDTTGTWSGGGKRKSKRRKSKRKKSKRKKRRKKKTKKRRRRKRQRGGMGQYNCVYPSNVGEIFTGIKLNKNPVLPDPINTNGNTRTVQKLKQKGGGFLDNIGLGDGLLAWYKGTNTISNVPIRYKGGKALMKADPMHQPGLYHEDPVHKTANVPKFYSSASDKAVDPKFTIKTE